MNYAPLVGAHVQDVLCWTPIASQGFALGKPSKKI